jgi:glucokinase
LILAGEIGGGTTSLALFEAVGAAPGELRLLRAATVANDEYPGLRPVVRRFAAQDLPRLTAACFVLAGQPPWPVEAAELAAAIGLPAVEVIDVPAARAEPAGVPAASGAAAPATPLWGAARRAARGRAGEAGSA